MSCKIKFGFMYIHHEQVLLRVLGYFKQLICDNVQLSRL